MTGVRSGSRLDQLQQLAARVRHELARARRAHDHHEVTRLEELQHAIDVEIEAERRARSTVALGVRATDQAVTARLAALGVTTRRVKEWAVYNGLLSEVRRGRVSAAVVDAYEQHHRALVAPHELARQTRRTQENP